MRFPYSLLCSRLNVVNFHFFVRFISVLDGPMRSTLSAITLVNFFGVVTYAMHFSYP